MLNETDKWIIYIDFITHNNFFINHIKMNLKQLILEQFLSMVQK